MGKEKAPRNLLPGVLRKLDLGDFYFSWNSPLGPVFIAYNKKGISAVMRARSGGAFERVLPEEILPPVYPGSDSLEKVGGMKPNGLRPGKAKRIPFDLGSLSPFEQAVLRKALEIPRGEVRPYGWIAREIGRPKAVRAVGTALAKNPIPILIPCHRVIRSDGQIGNYALGGKEKKMEILAAEGVDAAGLEKMAESKDALLWQRHHPDLLFSHLPPGQENLCRPQSLFPFGAGGPRRPDTAPANSAARSRPLDGGR